MSAYMYGITCVMPKEARKSIGFPETRVTGGLWAYNSRNWLLGTEPGSSTRASSALDHWAISSASICCYLRYTSIFNHASICGCLFLNIDTHEEGMRSPGARVFYRWLWATRDGCFTRVAHAFSHRAVSPFLHFSSHSNTLKSRIRDYVAGCLALSSSLSPHSLYCWVMEVCASIPNCHVLFDFVKWTKALP